MDTDPGVQIPYRLRENKSFMIITTHANQYRPIIIVHCIIWRESVTIGNWSVTMGNWSLIMTRRLLSENVMNILMKLFEHVASNGQLLILDQLLLAYEY